MNENELQNNITTNDEQNEQNEQNSGLVDLEPQGDIVGGIKGAPQTCINNTKSIGCSG